MDSTNINASVMSTEALVMSLLGQIQCLESERDNARILAARMRERLDHIQNNNLTTMDNSNDHKSDVNSGRRLAKIVKGVSSCLLNDIHQIITNEEQRFYNLSELLTDVETDQTAILRGQISVCKQHYEKLLDEAESEKVGLRKRLKEQQDMLLDKDIKIKELERKIEQNSALEGAK